MRIRSKMSHSSSCNSTQIKSFYAGQIFINSAVCYNPAVFPSFLKVLDFCISFLNPYVFGEALLHRKPYSSETLAYRDFKIFIYLFILSQKLAFDPRENTSWRAQLNCTVWRKRLYSHEALQKSVCLPAGGVQLHVKSWCFTEEK